MEENIKPKKTYFTFDKKEIMYALIVVFLMFLMYYVGTIATSYILNGVHQACPVLNVTSASPFGITYTNGSYLTNLTFPK